VAKTNNHDNQRNGYRMAQIYITFSNYLNISIGKSHYLSFTFNHALAKIGYAVKKGVTDDNVTITLNKITLAGSATDPKVGAFHTTGTINLSRDLTNAEDKTTLWTDCNGEQNFTWSSGFPNVTSPSFSAGSDYLFVIPQDFSKSTAEGGTKADELYVIVDYTISYNDGVTAAMKSTVSSPIVKNFEQGKAYTMHSVSLSNC
jgi:hypothetical protein